jgi:hypothetical protein
VPSNPKKIRDLIGGLERFAIRKDLSPIARALLVHLEFVTIHPFMDGNGRLGRLLMNQVLLGAGLPWVNHQERRACAFLQGHRASSGGWRCDILHPVRMAPHSTVGHGIIGETKQAKNCSTLAHPEPLGLPPRN